MQVNSSDPDIATLVGRIRKERLDLQPDFQRGEVWSKAKKQRLIDSILRGWHIPPVHVISSSGDRPSEVLDGQQRLAAVRDFLDNLFPFSGFFEPVSKDIQSLDGLYWRDMPPEIKDKISESTIRVMTISGYDVGEPAELFYRLNQPTNLTSAEQRNAYYGKPRQQVKDLSKRMLSFGVDDKSIGFSNSRMAYDDTISKVLLSLEYGSLYKKLTSNSLAERYRSGAPFDKNLINKLESSLEALGVSVEKIGGAVKLNKASLYSWLIFFVRGDEWHLSACDLVDFFVQFEGEKKRFKSSISSSWGFWEGEYPTRTLRSLMSIYLDRSSSRIADISSVILRDYCMWMIYFHLHNSSFEKCDLIYRVGLSTYDFEASRGAYVDEERALEIAEENAWGDFHV